MGRKRLNCKRQAVFLSARELADYVGNYRHAPGLPATDTAQSDGIWWLRSPDADKSIGAGAVLEDGYVMTRDVKNGFAVRTAFNLNLNSVLFTSAAVGGKPDGGSTPISEYSGNEWKLTLLDNSRNFAVTEKAVSAAPGGRYYIELSIVHFLTPSFYA